jgi:hypothetical protein
MIDLDSSSLVMIVILSSSYLPWSTHGLLFEKRDGCAPHHIVVKDSLISYKMGYQKNIIITRLSLMTFDSWIILDYP